MKHFKRILALALLAVTLLGVAMPAMAVTGIPVQSWAVINASDVNMRSGPGTEYSSFGRYPSGTRVWVTQTTTSTSGWYKVTMNGVTSNGWILQTYLSPEGGGSGNPGNGGGFAAGDTGKVNVSDFLYIREKANGTQDNGRLYPNCEVYIVSISGDWAYIRVTKSVKSSNGTSSAPVGTYGYVSVLYLTKVGSGGSTSFQSCTFDGYTNTTVPTLVNPGSPDQLGSTITGRTLPMTTYKDNTPYCYSWLKLNEGYILARLVNANAYTTGADMYAETLVKIYLRETPSSSASYFATVNAYNIVNIIDRSVSGWTRVATVNGTGWVEANTLAQMG